MNLIRALTIAFAVCGAVTVAAQEAATPALARDNVVILLDASGSMRDDMPGTSDSKMDVAKQALAKVVDRIDPQANVGLLVFSDIPESNGWLYDLGPLDRARLLIAIDSCQASGGTPLGMYLKTAADRLLEARQAQRGYGSYRLLVVTDGEANDPELLGRYLPDVLSRGVRIDCIGVAMREDHALAQHVHSYRRADDASTLEEAVSAALGEVGTSDSTDDVSAEQYELASAIPEESAVEIIGALTTPNNAPIGEGPAEEDPTEFPLGQGGQPYLGNQGSSWGDLFSGLCCCLFVPIVLIGVAFFGIAKVAKRRRR